MSQPNSARDDGPGDESRVMPAQRRIAIAEIFSDRPAVRIDDLAERFGVSRETIRRDLISLENRGLVQRVHGGGVRPEVDSREPSFQERMALHSAEKRAMATLAARLIGDAGTIFLDVGTSVARIADYIPQSFTGQVITNSILAASRLGQRDDIDVMVCGGRMRHGDLALSGPNSIEFLNDVFVEIAFLGSGGVHPAHGLTDFYPEEVATRRIVISNARSVYVMADSSKIGRVATQRVCPLDQVTGVITDSQADSGLLRDLRTTGIEVHVADGG
ncbi:MAG TPA: DeoR/GlpR family DNA-binding transcription regulator [Acidimicrobiia bacterium]|nr:DeoR/GlpR family DNA-binding transcription regulator [Acidimicrobiia bacterium]